MVTDVQNEIKDKHNKVIDRDIQRKHLIITNDRQIIEDNGPRQITESYGSRNLTEFEPQQFKIIRKRKLVA